LRPDLLKGRPRPDLWLPRCEERYRQAQCDSPPAPSTASDECDDKHWTLLCSWNSRECDRGEQHHWRDRGPEGQRRHCGATESAGDSSEWKDGFGAYRSRSGVADDHVQRRCDDRRNRRFKAKDVCCGNGAARGYHRGGDINRRAQTQLGTAKVFVRACRGEVGGRSCGRDRRENSKRGGDGEGRASGEQHKTKPAHGRNAAPHLDPCARSTHPVCLRRSSTTLGANPTLQAWLRNSRPAECRGFTVVLQDLHRVAVGIEHECSRDWPVFELFGL